jgi:hypothetical protein
MLRLLTEVGVFSPDMVGENGQLTAGAKITQEYVIMNPDGSFDYEIVDIGNGKGRNILKYDLDKIEKKVTPFLSKTQLQLGTFIYLEVQALKRTIRWLRTLTLEKALGAIQKTCHLCKTKKFYLKRNIKNTL